MDRRSFMKWAGVSTIAASLPVALSACVQSGSDSSQQTNDSQVSSPKPARSDGFIDVGSIDNLSESGSFRYQTDNGNAILVVQQTGAAATVQAFSSLCTHRGCNVGWQVNDKDISCACHGSRFSASGDVTQGPAESALAAYTTKIESDRILVKLA